MIDALPLSTEQDVSTTPDNGVVARLQTMAWLLASCDPIMSTYRTIRGDTIFVKVKAGIMMVIVDSFLIDSNRCQD